MRSGIQLLTALTALLLTQAALAHVPERVILHCTVTEREVRDGAQVPQPNAALNLWFSETGDEAGLSENSANKLFHGRPAETIWSGARMDRVYIDIAAVPSYSIPDYDRPFDDFVSISVSRLDGTFELTRKPAYRVESDDGDLSVRVVGNVRDDYFNDESHNPFEMQYRLTSTARGTCQEQTQKF